MKLKTSLIALCLMAAPTLAAADMKVRIHNNTGVEMYGFTSTNSGASNWGSDVFGQSTLPSGSSIVLNFSNSNGYCLFDFKAVFVDGDVLEKREIDVCSIKDFYYE